jgi:hypothetical protein
VHCSDGGAPHTPGPGQVQTGLVEANEVEFVCLPDHGLQGKDLIGDRILTIGIEAQRLPADWHQTRLRLGVAAREEGDLVSELDEILGEVRDHTFCTAIEPRRHCLMQWSNLRDPHQTNPPHLASKPSTNGYIVF